MCLKKEKKKQERENTDLEVLEKAAFPPPPAVDSQRGCCCRFACSDCKLPLPRLFLHKTGQQHTCPDRHKSENEKSNE